jgi:hypothetical protein
VNKIKTRDRIRRERGAELSILGIANHAALPGVCTTVTERKSSHVLCRSANAS